jgi:hypothetical protein
MGKIKIWRYFSKKPNTNSFTSGEITICHMLIYAISVMESDWYALRISENVLRIIFGLYPG